MKIGVIGGGSFGTSLAKLLADSGHDVTLWIHNPEVAQSVTERRENSVYLPGVPLPQNIVATSAMEQAVRDAEVLLAVSPSHVMREVMQQARGFVRGRPYVVTASKGVEEGSLKRMSEVLADVFGSEFDDRIVALSGPSFAKEVAAGKPTAVTAAGPTLEAAQAVQQIFQAPTFRVYAGTDVIGVELGGSAKNVIAIAAGVSDGLGLGSSSRAALITRGVAEIVRLVEKMGGLAQTVSGLSGVGDLVLTCTGDLSRNRTVGLRMGRGETLNEVLAGMKMVAEGVRNSISVSAMAKRAGVEMPIAEQIRLMLHEDKPALQVLGDLLRRQAKPEFYS
ncbi:MAG: NAD(P)-dependent glycerol-3-phosphate dehydrogenase [Deltaproteobacteria bacterium]|nr:NAD(P)-dependent glycerol-3-phosphate dehydrogenase [Deltaproteobacteria bacterium]